MGKPISKGELQKISEGLKGPMVPQVLKKSFYQWSFLKAVKRLEPDVLASLNSDIRPLYVHAAYGDRDIYKERHSSKEALIKWSEIVSSNYSQVRMGANSALEAPESENPHVAYQILKIERSDLVERFRRLDKALIQWAERWNMNVTWVLDMAVGTLYAWERDPSSGGQTWKDYWFFYHEPLEVMKLEPPVASFEATQKVAEKQYKVYLKQQEEIRRSEGWERVGKKEQIHFEWLARFQVLKQSHNEIANAYTHYFGQILKKESRHASLKV